ncbi:MAG: hypothetical protein KU29_10670 [Sulfurovum sp. FS06-10]|nr:MAG: hypothetical protein KU29_10670 [Sulfurovum sp. FS06-10]
MKFLILIVLVSSIYAKDKNIFLDTQMTIPFFGIGKEIDSVGDHNTYSSPSLFLGVALGYSINLADELVLDPSLGFNFNSNDILSINPNIFTYDYYDMTLPLMYHKKGFKGGVFFKYMLMPSMEMGGRLQEKIKLENQSAYTLGIKIVTRSWFFSYEYLLNGKYYADDKRSYMDIEGSRLSIGLRNTF